MVVTFYDTHESFLRNWLYRGIRHLNDLFPIVCSVVIALFYLGLWLYHDMGSHCGYILVCVVIASVLIVVS